MEKTTNTLTSILKKTSPDKVSEYLETYSDEMISSSKPFALYMRETIKQKGLQQQQVFLDANISSGYGYKILSEEKRTKQRDTIIRICLAAHFSLDEVQRALKIYGMSPLYPRLSRDALLIVAFNQKMWSIEEVDNYLTGNNEAPLKGAVSIDE